LPLPLIVPVSVIFAVKLVYVPPLANTTDLTFSVVAVLVVAPDIVLVLPVQSNILNQLRVVVSTSLEPPMIYKLGALAAVPPEVSPNLYALVTVITVLKPPVVPVHVKPVAFDIDRVVADAVLVLNIIKFVPNDILRVFELVERNVPVVRSNPFKTSEPAVRVVVLVTPNINALPNVQSPPAPFNIKLQLMVIPLVVIVLPVVVALKVKVPVADQTVVAVNDILPDTAIVPVLVKVTVPADTVISKQVSAPVNVTV
jgi:hypothetical protein